VIPRRVLAAAAAVAVAALLSAPAVGAPGSLDHRFGGDGVVTAFATGGVATAVGIDRAGRIVVAGYTVRGGVDVAVARFRPNGTFDPRFGTGGRVRIDLGGADAAFDLAIEPAGDIAVAGRTSAAGAADMFALVLDPTGTPVPTFGTNGVARVAFGWKLQGANAVAVAPNGRLVLGGYTSNGAAIRSAVVRLRSDGALDPTFSHDGRATVDVSAGGDQVNDLLALPGGRVVAAGSADAGLVPQVALFRLRSDGSLDPTFGTAGITRTNLGAGGDVGNALTATADHHLVVVGLAGNEGRDDWGVARYGPGGRPDPAFGSRGIVVLPFGGAVDEALDVAARGPNLLIVGRIHSAAKGDNAGVVRLRPNGTPDPDFGAGGTVRVDLAGSTDVARAVAIQPNGRIVLAGEGRRGGIPRFVLARLLAT
jgi:uncharacterized delta-60 repeat protein